MNIVTEKRCSKCGEIRNVTDFYKSKTSKSGRAYQCKYCAAENMRRWSSFNREKLAEKSRVWRQNNPGKNRDAIKKWAIEHVDKIREWAKERRAKHPEKAYKWKRNNPEKIRIYNKNRKAKKRGGSGVVSAKDWTALKNFYGNKCLCCGLQESEIKLTLDHVIPLALGGEHSIKNAQPLCGICNGKKYTKIIDYRPDNGEYARRL